MAGSVAPISTVGGSRHTAHEQAAQQDADRSRGRRRRCRAARRAASPNSTSDARSRRCRARARRRRAAGAGRGATSRGSSRLPRHMPPMNVPSSTPSETADEPITSCSSWNQTTLVDQRRAAAADEEQEQPRQEAGRRQQRHDLARPLLFSHIRWSLQRRDYTAAARATRVPRSQQASARGVRPSPSRRAGSRSRKSWARIRPIRGYKEPLPGAVVASGFSPKNQQKTAVALPASAGDRTKAAGCGVPLQAGRAFCEARLAGGKPWGHVSSHALS